MNHKVLVLSGFFVSLPLFASTDNDALQHEIHQLQQQTNALQEQLMRLQKRLAAHSDTKPKSNKLNNKQNKHPKLLPKKQATTVFPKTPSPPVFHDSILSVHTLDTHPEAIGFYPTALIADNRVITYVAGTPVVTSPYTGDRPAFDGSDYIVNISSINRDIRLMQQRRRLYRAYESIGYPIPNIPIIAISGKSEPVMTFSNPYRGQTDGDVTLGSNELDVAAALNQYVEAFTSIAFDSSPPELGGPRVSNSSFDLNLGFVNIGNLDKSPFYFTAGQLYAPYGRYSSSMISSPISLNLARTKTRPFILGYKSQTDTGPYAAGYGFISETTLGHSGVGGINIGYLFGGDDLSGDIGAGMIGSIADSQGMQDNGLSNGANFGGFSSITNGSERVRKVPGLNFHTNVSFDRYSLTAEWVGASKAFRPQDLSFNGRGAKPQAAQLEAGVTFKTFDKPASIGIGYQWSKETLALNLPEHRFSTVFNISIWKDTVESLEYRHDVDFNTSTYANGAAPFGFVNANTYGTGQTADTLIAQIGVYF